MTNDTQHLARAAGTVMIAFVAANLAGLVRQTIINRTFGTTVELDAYFAAFQVPDLLFNVVAGGALGSAFIPIFSGLLAKDNRQAAWRLASAITNLLFVVLSVGGLLAGLTAPWLVDNLLAPRFDTAQVLLTTSLMRIMLFSTVIFGTSGLLMGIHNAHDHFISPAIAPVFYNLGIIAGALLLTPTLGIHGLAWGVLIGALGHLLVQLPLLRRHQGSYTLTLGLHNANTLRVGQLMLPRTLGLAVWRINFWVNTAIGSALPIGSISALNIAFQIFTFPLAVIAQAIATVVFPTFSAQAARNEIDSMRDTLAQSLRGVLYLAIPSTAGMLLLGRPIIALFFQNDQFTAESTALVYWALAWYAVGLLAHSLLEIVTRVFYALEDTTTPVVMAVIAMSLNVALSLLFVRLFDRWGWQPLGGLALANTLATAVEVGVLLVRLRPRLRGLGMSAIVRGSRPTLAGTAAMGLALWGWLYVAPASLWVVSIVGVALGAGVFYSVSLVLGSPEARLLPALVRQRLRK